MLWIFKNKEQPKIILLALRNIIIMNEYDYISQFLSTDVTDQLWN